MTDRYRTWSTQAYHTAVSELLRAGWLLSTDKVFCACLHDDRQRPRFDREIEIGDNGTVYLHGVGGTLPFKKLVSPCPDL